MEFFDVPGCAPRLVQVDSHEVEVRVVAGTFMVPVHVGDGCYNDTAADIICWRAEYRGRDAFASTPEAAARMVLIQ